MILICTYLACWPCFLLWCQRIGHLARRYLLLFSSVGPLLPLKRCLSDWLLREGTATTPRCGRTIHILFPIEGQRGVNRWSGAHGLPSLVNHLEGRGLLWHRIVIEFSTADGCGLEWLASECNCWRLSGKGLVIRLSSSKHPMILNMRS